MSDYKRLTNNNLEEYNPEYDFCMGCKYFGEPNGCNRPNGPCGNYERFLETYNRLCELEDKIENGTLIELQDKEENLIGQQVYAIDICSYPEGEIVTNFDIEEDEIIIGFTSNEIVTVNTTRGCNMYHKNGLWFLTKAEAEKKLKELRGKENDI